MRLTSSPPRTSRLTWASKLGSCVLTWLMFRSQSSFLGGLKKSIKCRRATCFPLTCVTRGISVCSTERVLISSPESKLLLAHGGEAIPAELSSAWPGTQRRPSVHRALLPGFLRKSGAADGDCCGSGSCWPGWFVDRIRCGFWCWCCRRGAR